MTLFWSFFEHPMNILALLERQDHHLMGQQDAEQSRR
jgi:hypothetical protein